ncbi:hypothetical protein JCM8547_007540 [Rhodosporidiobolus lusitaniae]
MPRKPSFELHSGDHSDREASPHRRPSSRDRFTASSSSSSSPRPHPPPPLSSRHSARRYSNDSGPASPSQAPGHHLCDVGEEEALVGGFGDGETDALLDSRGRNGSKRKLSLTGRQNGYGATEGSPGGGLFLTLNEGGATLSREESVLRLAGLIDDRAGEYEKFRKSPEQLKQMRKPVRRFYERQNEQLDQFAEVDEILDNARAKATGELIGENRAAEREELRTSIRWAINANLVINILLIVAKVAVVLLSHSMSLVASTVDSAMDLLSTVIIFFTSQYIDQRDWKSQYAYPTGKQRMEPLGVLVFSVFMISSFLQVLIESLQKLFSPDLGHTQIPPVALGVMGGTIIIKGGIWLACRSIRSASVEALQQDAENDIVFNLFSILFPFIGQLIHFRYLDPIGGAVLSIYIIAEWTGTLFDNVRKLTGKRAPPQEHQRIAYLLTRFSPLINSVQHLSLYYAGEGMLCEVDIVLPAQTPLTKAHDVGEAAQYAIEELEGIDRAFVHVDVTVNPKSGARSPSLRDFGASSGALSPLLLVHPPARHAPRINADELRDSDNFRPLDPGEKRIVRLEQGGEKERATRPRVNMVSPQADGDGEGVEPGPSSSLSPSSATSSPRRRPLSELFHSPKHKWTLGKSTAVSKHSALPALAALDSLPPPDPATLSPLDPPALPFSASTRRRTRSASAVSTRSSSSSTPSSSPSTSARLPPAAVSRPPASTDAHSHGNGMNGLAAHDMGDGAQEELLDERAMAQNGNGGQAGYVDPYSWERPLDAVNRHSRLLDAAPVVPSTPFGSDQRRLSRLPPGVSMVDPFGFNLTADPSPYDLASLSSAPPAPGANALSRSSPVRSSFLMPGTGGTVTSSPQQLSPRASYSGPSSHNHGHAPSGSTSSFSHTPGSSDYHGAGRQPWLKPRANSAGEQGGQYGGGARPAMRNGYLTAPPGGMPRGVSQRSKLSGEIDADAMSITSTTSRQTTSIPSVPTDADYLNSKLYQRTLKAQKALEKERAKAAAKGKLSRYDEEASKSTGSLTLGFGGMRRRESMDSTHRPPSIMSAVGVAGSTGKRVGRKSALGWFRSGSETALTLSSDVPKPVVEAVTPPLPVSKSASQISMQAGRRSPTTPEFGYGGVVAAGGGGSAPGSGASTPLPPSPNLPSEATLRAMGVSPDQLRAAGNKPVMARPASGSGSGTGASRPRSGGRQGSGGKSPQVSMQPSMSPVPPSPTESNFSLQQQQQQPKTTAVPLSPKLEVPPSNPPSSSRPLPSRSTSLEPPAPSPALSPQPSPPLVNAPPRTASRSQPAASVPLPKSASPTSANFPPSAAALPPSSLNPSRQPSPHAQQQHQQLPPPVAAVAQPAPPPQAYARPSPASQSQLQQPFQQPSRTLPAGAAPPSITPPAPSASAPASLAPPRPAADPLVKRRKSGLGLLFGRSSSSTSGTNSERSSIASSSALGSGSTTREASPPPPAAAAVAEKPKKMTRKEASEGRAGSSGRGGFFGFGGGSGGGGNKLSRSSGPAPSGPVAPPPPPGARPPQQPKKKEKKKEEFFHPSQMRFGAPPPPPAPSAPAPRSPLPPSTASYPSPPQQQIRAINASPHIPSSSSSHPPCPNPQSHLPNGAAHSPRTDSSSGSSTTFSSLSSSASTLPPSTPANLPIQLDSAVTPLGSLNGHSGKKSGFAAFFSSSSSSGGGGGGKSKAAPGGGGKALPGVPAPPQGAAGAVLQKPPRGQSLGMAMQGEQQPQQEVGQHRPYPTYS